MIILLNGKGDKARIMKMTGKLVKRCFVLLLLFYLFVLFGETWSMFVSSNLSTFVSKNLLWVNVGKGLYLIVLIISILVR